MKPTSLLRGIPARLRNQLDAIPTLGIAEEVRRFPGMTLLEGIRRAPDGKSVGLVSINMGQVGRLLVGESEVEWTTVKNVNRVGCFAYLCGRDGQILVTTDNAEFPFVIVDLEDPKNQTLVGNEGFAIDNTVSGTGRMNDGAVDNNGHAVMGSIETEEFFAPTSAFWAVDGVAKTAKVIVPGISVTNGAAFLPTDDPRRQLFVFVDSRKTAIFCMDWDSVSGKPLGLPRVFSAPLTFAPGDDSLWDGADPVKWKGETVLAITQWGAHSVLLLDLTGKPIGKVLLPAKRPTCVTAVGSTLLITTEVFPGDRDYEKGAGIYSCKIKGLGDLPTPMMTWS